MKIYIDDLYLNKPYINHFYKYFNSNNEVFAYVLYYEKNNWLEIPYLILGRFYCKINSKFGWMKIE